jgi:hypothetical protein
MALFLVFFMFFADKAFTPKRIENNMISDD